MSPTERRKKRVNRYLTVSGSVYRLESIRRLIFFFFDFVMYYIYVCTIRAILIYNSTRNELASLTHSF